MKRFICLLIISIFLPLSSYAAAGDELPSALKTALKDAYDTKNLYVIDAVTKVSKESYPTYADKINSYLASLQMPDETQTKISKGLSGNVDTGVNITNGNTKGHDFSFSSKINYESDKWENILNFSVKASHDNDITTDEEYIANNQTKYNYNSTEYSFLELEYVNDRFAGYKHRSAQLLGHGHRFFKSDALEILGEASVGARQTRMTDGEEKNSILSKIAAKVNWSINDRVSMANSLHSSFGSDVVISIFDSAITTKITESLYLKFNYNLQHVDDAPRDKDHIDTLTSVSLGYKF